MHRSMYSIPDIFDNTFADYRAAYFFNKHFRPDEVMQYGLTEDAPRDKNYRLLQSYLRTEQYRRDEEIYLSVIDKIYQWCLQNLPNLRMFYDQKVFSISFLEEDKVYLSFLEYYETNISTATTFLKTDWDWDFIPPYDFHAKKASYSRILSEGYDEANHRTCRHAYAICLPFTYDFNAQPDFKREQIGIYNLKYISDKYEFVFDHHGYVMEEGTPYLVVVNEGIFTIEAENVHVTDYTRSSEVQDFKTFERVGEWKGTFRRITSVEAEPMWAYGLQWDGKWRRYRTDYEGYEKSWIGAGLSYFSFDAFSGRNTYSTVVGGYNGADDEDGYTAPFPADLYDGDDSIPDDDLTEITPTFRTLDADGSSHYFDLQGRLIDDKPQQGMFINNNKKTIIK